MKTVYVMTLLASMLGITTANAATFDGNTCVGDCSGHQAGYDWAEQNNVDDESSCSAPSASFNQGCESYVGGGSGVIYSDDEDDDDDE